MNPNLRILLADDHPLFRHGLRQIIQAESACQIEEASDGTAALKLIESVKPDICILDVSMPGIDGLGVVREMRRRQLPGDVIVLTMHKEEDLFNSAMDLGVKGYVLKESAVPDIVTCLARVAAGHSYISPVLSGYLLARRADAQSLRQGKPGLLQLTPAERRVLKLIAQDKTSKEIAKQLGVSLRTIENHRTNICSKLDVHGIHSLLKFAFENQSRL